MALMIQTTGLEEYAPGGNARIKVLSIGGPGAGKTRWASYFPKPIYADCERGLASVADRNVAFVNISTSQDMLDLLAHLKQECRQPYESRTYQTIVIDTLDAFQRKIKNEWMEKERKQVFTGWEAWGYLNARMQMLMTRLLNLDMHVVVNCHYKDRTTKDDETGKESHELMLQLQGELSDTAFNDFDMVGWLGTYWESVDGVRVQKRGITFQPTPDKPFLKDRLHVTPSWLEIDFAPSDYQNLFEAVQGKIADIGASTVVGEIVAENPTPPSTFVIPPGAIGSGPVAASLPREIPLAQMDKTTLLKTARDRGITTTVDGAPIKGNTLKSELLAVLEATANATPTTPAAPTATTAEPTKPTESPQPTAAVVELGRPLTSDAPTVPAANPRRTVVKTEAGHVDASTGELIDAVEQAVKTVQAVLGGTVVAETAAPAAPAGPTGAPAPVAAEQLCETCQKNLADENQDMVKLAWIKYRKRLCNEHYATRKSAGR